MTKEEALKILDTIPTIGEQVEALEIAIESLEREIKGDKTAYWIKEEKEPLIEIFTCSSCNDEWKIDSNDEETVNVDVEKCFKYCPNCGAKILGVKMKEGE